MNYIKELNSFKDWLLVNELSPHAVLLWHSLMMINNMAHWKRIFNAPRSLVESLTGLPKTTMYNARKELEEAALIKVNKGIKGRAPCYEMISFEEPSWESFQEPSKNESGNILKQKQNKTKREEEGHAVLLFKTYEENISKLNPLTRTALQDWMERLNEEIVMEAIKVTNKYGGSTLRYVERILQEWLDANLNTLPNVQAYEEKKLLTKHNTVPFTQKKKGKSMWDELLEEAANE